jgi:type I restriction enzyme R subunit
MFPVLSDRHNIVVIADEAHRTQYGFEAKLKTRKGIYKPNVAETPVDIAQAAIKYIATGAGEAMGLSEDEVKFYDALATSESAVRDLTDETLKKIAHELTDNLRQSLSVDWSERTSVRAKLRLMVKRILRKYKYPPALLDGAVELVLQQAQVMGESWSEQ